MNSFGLLILNTNRIITTINTKTKKICNTVIIKGEIKQPFTLFQYYSTEWWQIQSKFIKLLLFVNQLRADVGIKDISATPVFFIITIKDFFCKLFITNKYFPVISYNHRQI